MAACGSPAPSTRPVAAGSTSSVRIGPFTQVFATSLPADPAQAKIITDFREAQVLWVKSNSAWHLVAPIAAYVTGDALSHLDAATAHDKSADVVPAGTDRLFLTRVTAIAGSTATVTTCDDSSKYEFENPSTRQVNPAFTPPRDQAYLFETWHMVQLSAHWAISSFSVATLPDRAAQPCQPSA